MKAKHSVPRAVRSIETRHRQIRRHLVDDLKFELADQLETVALVTARDEDVREELGSEGRIFGQGNLDAFNNEAS